MEFIEVDFVEGLFKLVMFTEEIIDKALITCTSFVKASVIKESIIKVFIDKEFTVDFEEMSTIKDY